MPGYATTPLWRKLGLRADLDLHLVNLTSLTPPPYWEEAGHPGPAAGSWTEGFELLHLFVDRREALASFLPRAARAMDPAGCLWVSWPKKVSRQPCDFTEDAIRELALPLGLVDVKVCSVSDELWSGLKLVVRRELRGSWPEQG